MSAGTVFNTMSGTWKIVMRALTEARDPVETLYNYVLQRHGENEADELRGAFNAWPAADFKKMAATRYMDSKVDSLIAAAIVARNPEDAPAEPKKSAGRPVARRGYDDDDVMSNHDKGSMGAEPIPVRPDRAGVKMGAAPERKPVADPRSKDFQQAGGATRQHAVQAQASQDGGNTTFKGSATTAKGDPWRVEKPIPKSDAIKELERLRSRLNDEDWITKKVHDYIKKNNVKGDEIGGVKGRLIAQMKAKIQSLGNAGSSTVKKKTGMDPDKFFKHGGARKDVEDMPASTIDKIAGGQDTKKLGTQAGPTPPIDPETGGVRRGEFVGQHYGRSGFSKPAKDRKNKDGTIDKGDAGRNPELDARRAGGMSGRPVQYSSGATGQMARGHVAANPAKPDSEWRDGHDMWWSGDKAGWVTKSQFAAMVASGQIRRKKDPGPSKPDLTKPQYKTVSPPDGRAKKPT